MAAANDLDNGAKPWTAEDLIGHVRLVLPDITEDVLKSLLLYIKSAGVTSEADIDKIEAKELSAIVGAENAIALLDYFKKQALISKKPLCHVDTSPTAAAAQPSPVAPVGGVSQDMVQFPTAAAAQPPAVAPVGGVSQDMFQLFKMVVEIQKDGNEQNRKTMENMQKMQLKTMEDMQKTQTQFLVTVKEAVVETSSMVKDALETVTKQTTEQARMQRETLTAMQQTTEAATKTNQEAMSAMQLNMAETRRMNSETTQFVHQSIATMLEEQRRSAQEVQKMLKPAPKDDCVIQ
ncbi:uncharacterized protein [Dermacentor albipictus]|uniref:uncharacterized protein n=1 Tax=Dermacentor albipictus TaxID=60249 RepID=UPI0031FBDDF9